MLPALALEALCLHGFEYQVGERVTNTKVRCDGFGYRDFDRQLEIWGFMFVPVFEKICGSLLI